MQLQGVLTLVALVAPTLSAPLLNTWNRPRFWNSYEDMSMEDYVLGYLKHNGRPSTTPNYWLRSVEDNSWEYPRGYGRLGADRYKPSSGSVPPGHYRPSSGSVPPGHYRPSSGSVPPGHYRTSSGSVPPGHYRPSSGSVPPGSGITIGYGYDTSYEDYLEYQYMKELLGAGKPRGVPSQRRDDKVSTIQ